MPLALMIGLPTAGKTTYLAALWDALESGTSPLRLSKLPASTAYLSHIRDAWLNCTELGRTSHAGTNETTLDLITPTDTLSLTIPDLSGEHFQNAWEKRTWSLTIDDLVREANGLLLFVHSAVDRPVSLDLLNALVDAVGGLVQNLEPGAAAPLAQPQDQLAGSAALGGSQAGTEQTDASSTRSAAWRPELASTEVKVVDLLQVIASRRQRDTSTPLAVVVSAWDLTSGRLTPSEWVHQELPLLDQYLATNSRAYDPRFFGVSAQGGSLNEADRLRKIARPADRTISRDDAGSVDLGEPVVWLAHYVG